MNDFIAFLNFFDHAWPFILIIFACIIRIYFEWKKFAPLTKTQKIEIALKAIQETMIKRVSWAEVEWQEFAKTGSIKRAQVIAEIYEEYPVLKEYMDQESLTKKIDELIDESLTEVRKVISDGGKK